jgi:O-succinylbenzoate synthase
MKIEALTFTPYEILLTSGKRRAGILINLMDEKSNSGWGDIAPLCHWSQETLEDSFHQLDKKRDEIIKKDWTENLYLTHLKQLQLFPSALFGLESALLSLLLPLPEHHLSTSALLKGSPEEILFQAKLRHHEGFTSAKLKVSNLSFKEATEIIQKLIGLFQLRIDVNRAWNTQDSLRFFSQFPLDTFDYVEEPFQNPHELGLFLHPLAIDESFPQHLTLEELESFPTLKALIYKPTIHGGMLNCLPLHDWTIKKGIQLILSSSYESDIGLAHIASMAHRLSIKPPLGIGTYHYLRKHLCANPLQFHHSFVTIPAKINFEAKL